MPIYEYKCNDCDHIFEEWQKNFEEQQCSCPVCNGASKRLISNSSFILKGSGWYVTDYAGKRASGSNGGSKKEKPAAKAKEPKKKEKSGTSSSPAANSKA